MDLLALIKDFGLPIGLLLAIVLGLVRTIRDIVTGELVVPRYVYDDKCRELEEVKIQLRRAVTASEKATFDVAEPAVQLAKRAVQRG